MTDRDASRPPLAAGAVARAAELLSSGEVVALPTDTVYGLGARADDPKAAAKIFTLKGRPDSVALPVLVSDLDQALELVEVDPLFSALAMAFWPGPLTIVARRKGSVDFRLGGDESTIGLRCPGEEVVRRLAAKVGPLAVTSANRHDEPPLTTPAALRELFGEAVFVLDGGERSGTPSTVVATNGGTLEVLRAGALGERELLALLRAKGAIDPK